MPGFRKEKDNMEGVIMPGFRKEKDNMEGVTYARV